MEVGLGVNWKILLGQIINFSVLFFLLKKFVFGAFLKILEKRKEIIERGLKKSEDAEKNLAHIRDLEKKIRESGERKAKELMILTQSAADKRRQEILELAEKEKEKILLGAKETAKKELEDEKERQKRESISLSFLLAERFLKEKMSQEEDKVFLEEMAQKLK